MRIAVTGTKGQVALSLAERGRLQGHDVVLVGRPRLELTGPANAIFAALEEVRPDIIVSAAAYTQVDQAEAEPDRAFAINERGAAAVAAAAARLDVPLIHLSTDYVFDGSSDRPYLEQDEAGPRTVYGASKLAGERAVAAAQPNSVILRTAWVYSPFGSNFVRTMLRLAETRDEIRVVADQLGNPTSALDIADGILAVASNLRAGDNPDLRGVFHMASAGEASWAVFAQRIFDEARALGGMWARITPVATADYPTAATRPANSRLNADRLADRHGVRLPRWEESLDGVVRRLLEDAKAAQVRER